MSALERLALVGWFWSSSLSVTQDDARTERNENRVVFPHDKIKINPTGFASLRKLRDAVPSLREKLEPPIEYQSGLLNASNDVWSIYMPVEEPKTSKVVHDDSSPLYWTSAAKFDINGRPVTLSLGGVRLRKVENLCAVLTPLMGCLTTLDLSNTDMDPSCMAELLHETQCVKNLYIGGNAWSSTENIRCVAESIPWTVQVVDCPYSNWNAKLLQSFVFPNENTQTTLERIEKFYLEGNPLQDNGVECLSKALEKSRLRELFLGQCAIGAAGAQTLASSACPTLQKLYLEGNQIGTLGAQSLLGGTLITHLDKLYIDNNGIPKELSIQIGRALQSPTMIGEGGFYQDH